MKNKIKKYSLLLVAIVMVLVSCIAVKVNAADPTTGSITIIVHEQRNEDTTTNPPLSGIEYTVYKVDETCNSKYEAENYIEENSVEGISKTTGEDGTVIFENLELGRYYVSVTSLPDGALQIDEFLVDIPMTNAEGTGWDYDITVEPKVKTAYGNLELTKKDISGNPIEGVTFKLQAYRNTIMAMSVEDMEEKEWVDYIPEGSDTPLTVTTDENGKIYINNLPSSSKYVDEDISYEVKYRLIEISAPDGYIINNYALKPIEFFVEYDGSISFSYSEFLDLRVFPEPDYDEENNITKITYINEKPEIVKKVKNSNGELVDSIGANATDRLTFKITADVPIQIYDMATYKITDELPDGIILDRDSIKVEGTTEDGSEIISEDMYTLSQDGLELTFDTSKMYDVISYSDGYFTYVDDIVSKYENIIITYEATIDKDNVVIGGDGNINTATLEYTNNMDVEYDEYGNPESPLEISTTTVSDTAEVHTGAVAIEKVERGNVSAKLAGAKFKIATTRENAENGVFIQDETGAEIEVITNDQGQAIIEGLKYEDDGSNTSYWLVETQAPSYEEDGETKYYNLLKNSVEVQVGKTTHETPVQIQNSKGFDLPATGGIGLALFTVAGITFMAVAVVLNKKQKVQE